MIKKYLLFVLAVCGVAAPQEPLEAREDFWREAVLYRDEWGVPHIYADNTRAMAFAFGYAQAEDQLGLLLNFMAAIQSKSAAINGEATLATDLSALIWRHVEKAKEGFPRLDAQLQRNYTAYTAGLEHYLADHPELRPAWLTNIEPWIWVAISITRSSGIASRAIRSARSSPSTSSITRKRWPPSSWKPWIVAM